MEQKQEKTPRLSMGLWMATEGGRKCPQCGRYAKPSELGYIGGRFGNTIITMYGHTAGFGCNAKVETP